MNMIEEAPVPIRQPNNNYFKVVGRDMKETMFFFFDGSTVSIQGAWGAAWQRIHELSPREREIHRPAVVVFRRPHISGAWSRVTVGVVGESPL